MSLFCSKCWQRRLREMWRIWKYSLGAFSDEKTEEYDNMVCVVRTCIFVSILSTNMMIVAGNVRHWNDVDYTTQYKELPRGDY